MKRVVIIGSDFSPSSMPPATRIRFFAKHLPEFGWEPIVLTAKPEYYDWPVDSENDRLLSGSLEVIRTRALRSSWTRKIGVGDIGMRSLWHTWRALKQICTERRIDLIFIPVPPYVPMVLGRLAHLKFGIPYVVDFIDPWVTEYYWKLPRKQRPPKWPLAYALSRTVEPFALGRVSHITGVSKGTTDSVVERYKWLREEDATEIPYGAEASDFEYLRQHPRSNPIFDRNDGLEHISYVGACIPAMYAAVNALFRALRLGLESNPELFRRIRLHFIGTNYAPNGNSPHNVVALADIAGIGEYVDERPSRVPYLESLQVMLDSDVLLLLGSDEPHYTASKVFPYILACRPLLAIFHQASSVVRIMRETNTGEVVTFNSTSGPEERALEICQRLTRLAEEKEKHQPLTSWERFEQYTTSAMTARLVNCFMKVSTDS